MAALQTAVLHGEVDATKAAQHDVDDINAKIARIREAVKHEEDQALENCKDVEELQKGAKTVRVWPCFERAL